MVHLKKTPIQKYNWHGKQLFEFIIDSSSSLYINRIWITTCNANNLWEKDELTIRSFEFLYQINSFPFHSCDKMWACECALQFSSFSNCFQLLTVAFIDGVMLPLLFRIRKAFAQQRDSTFRKAHPTYVMKQRCCLYLTQKSWNEKMFHFITRSISFIDINTN